MKLELLTGYIYENHRDPNSLKIYYDFSGISGFFVPNNLYKNQKQFAQVPGGYTVNSQYYPGVFVSCYQNSIFTGSGIFNGETNLKVLNELSGNNISLLYNFGQLNCNTNFTINSKQIQIPTGKIQILSYIESKNTNSSTPFEIILGLNDAYKLTLEFSGKIGNSVESYKSTNFGELAFQNAGGLRLNDRNIEFSYFDIIEDEIYNNLINLTGSYFNQEKNIYIGNIPTGKFRKGYTGFIGNLDDFIAFDGYYDQKFCASIADIFIKTGDGIQVLNITGVNYNIIQSGFLNPTGILGTGITGYQLVPSDNIINADCGSSCVVYVNSGVTGLITGEKIEYKIVGQQQYSTIQQTIKYNLYDQDYASKFTKNYIVFTTKLDQQDIFDIQVYADVDTISSQPTYALVNQYYIAQDLLTDRELLIFLNGVNIPSGNYEVIGNDYRFVIKEDNRLNTDLTLYSVSQFDSINQTNINYTGQSQNILNFNLNKINAFLNGQKLISGYHYSNNSSTINYNTINIPTTGNLYIIEDKYTSEITGSDVKYYNPTVKYNNERIWLNGIFQNKNENYILTSCRNSMLLPSGDIEIKSENIFNNQYNRFNL
jgi:hypothetical protein